MPELKMVISDPKTGKAEQVVLKADKALRLLGLKIGDVVDGAVAGKPGIKLKITGGSGRAGEPMRPDLPGGVKKRLLLSSPPGYHPARRGMRRRKLVRGNTITEDIVQVNTVVLYE